MTDTAKLADIVLPATMFLEHDDLYRGGGHQHILLGPKLVEPPSTVRTNLFVIEELAKRLGIADRPGFGLSERDHIDRILVNYDSGYDHLKAAKWLDVQPDFATAHFVEGFAHADGRFRFRADWTGTPAPNRPPAAMGMLGPVEGLPVYPDHADLIESADADHPFRLATSPARSFLNSSFAETPGSVQKEGRPEVMIHAADAARLGIAEGDVVRLGNVRGELRLHARLGGGTRPGVVIAEGLWPNGAHLDGEGINVLTGADSVAPYGGAAFHDNRIWLKRDETLGMAEPA